MRAVTLVVCVAMLAVACRGNDDSSAKSTTSTTGSSTAATTTGKAVDFGTLKNVCQPGDAHGATGSTGVGNDGVHVATFSDPGFSGRPGLNQELFDTAEVFTKWCNAAGGINGRKIILDERDAALTNLQAQIVRSCSEDFFMVGGGNVFDNNGIRDRLECMLPEIPGYIVTPEARSSDLFVLPAPSPPSTTQVGDYRWLGKKFPESTKHIGVLTGDINTTVKVAEDDKQFVQGLGWNVVYSDRYPVIGNVGWASYVQALKDKGVKGIIWVGEPENLAKFEQAMADAGFTVDWLRASPNHYDDSLIKIGGDALKNTYVWIGSDPFDDTSNPAMRQYLDLAAKYKPNGKSRTLLAAQSWSAWLLFAQAARECGNDLTRRCVYDNARKIHQWTGGGMFPASDPGNNRGASCYLLLRATPQGFKRVDTGANNGLFSCGPQNAYHVKGDPNVSTKLSDVGKTLNDLK
jgi:hypothetical protein